MLEGRHPAEEQVFLGREVVEDRDLRYVGGGGDLGHRHTVEAALGEQPLRRLEYGAPRRFLLPLAQPRRGVHNFIITARYSDLKF